MYRAREYVFLTPRALGRRRYRAVCAELDLEPTERGYGALLCHDEQGVEITMLTADTDYLSMIVASVYQLNAVRAGTQEPTRVAADRFPLARRGWPTRHCRCA